MMAMHMAAHRKPGKIETCLSMACMAILVIVGAGVIVHQFHINPAVVALRLEYHGKASPPESNQSALIDTTNSKIVPFSPPERFEPAMLYEKINARANLYLSAGFVSLDTQRLTLNKGVGSWVELFVYDVVTPPTPSDTSCWIGSTPVNTMWAAPA